MSKYLVIACEIMFREVSYCAAMSNHIIDTIFITKGLHDIGAIEMNKTLQREIDKVDVTNYDAILLAYGLCNHGVVGLTAKIQMVIPKCHDCIAILLGSHQRYDEYFKNNPGVFFKSAGWLERDVHPNSTGNSITSNLGLLSSYESYLDEYDQETVDFLTESLGNWLKNYTGLTYIDTGVGNSRKYEEMTRTQAKEQALNFDMIEGNLRILHNLFDGKFDTDCLVVPPNHKIIATNDETIIACEL